MGNFKLKLNGGGFTEFKEMIESFVQDNFEVTGCRECHETGNGEIVPDNFKKSYDKELLKLYNELAVG